jgi:quercetin dioxygenase-like cupin family protein
VADQLLQDTKKATFYFGKGERDLNMRSIVGVACAAVAITAAMPAVAFGDGDVVTPNFEQAIPNTPGKSLIAVVVDYPPGGTSLPHTQAKSAFIFAYILAGEIESR